ncbi:MAG: methylaspartate ammonia-lyase [Acidimicrobiales bacterium]
MRIVDAFCTQVSSGFFRDDQQAIRLGAGHDGFLYSGTPTTPGFSKIREAGVAFSILLILDDGQIAVGDCAEVQYAGTGGRAALLSRGLVLDQLEEVVLPELIGREVDGFRELAEWVEGLRIRSEPLLTALRYGVSQAILHGASLAARTTMAEVVQREYGIEGEITAVPIFAQTGDDRYLNVDKMIVKEVDALPHGLINEVDSKLGQDGEILLDYVRWVTGRIRSLRRDETYLPRLHLDTYGTIGLAFDSDLARITDYLCELKAAAGAHELWIEHPIDAGSRDAQVETYVALRNRLRKSGVEVALVVDEWCNTLEDIDVFTAADAADVIHVKTPDLGGVNKTVEALLMVRQRGLRTYCGGTCNETDLSSRVSTHVAMACHADQMLAKPGMGVDEGVMIVRNEMLRTLALVKRTKTLADEAKR